MAERLAGKTVLVTGAGSGFGAATAELFAQHGAQVIVADININGGEAVAAKHQNLHFLKLDVTSGADWHTAVDLAESKWSGIDVLINNAGASYRNKPTLEVTEAEFEKCVKVNLESIYLSVKIVVARMVARGKGGSVVNVSSIGSSRPRPGLVWYNASKGAVSNVSRPSPCHDLADR
jgi:NAD(P)-dependent dehydrogenase (short-subunit alcohol dehydrogenase family)